MKHALTGLAVGGIALVAILALAVVAWFLRQLVGDTITLAVFAIASTIAVMVALVDAATERSV